MKYLLPLVPSAPPENIQIETLNETTAFVKWSPPPPQHFNGHLLGYKVRRTGFNFAVYLYSRLFALGELPFYRAC